MYKSATFWIVLGVPLLCLGPLAPPSSAQDFNSRDEEQNRRLLESMESAPPAPMPAFRPVDGPGVEDGGADVDTHRKGSGSSCDPPLPNLFTHSFPHSAVFKLLAKYTSGGTDYYYACSAAAVGSFHLVTAGHCIYQHDPNQDSSTDDAGFATEVWAWAAQTDYVNPFRGSPGDADRPYGFAKSTYLRTYSGWSQDANLDDDIAFITLDRRVGDRTGWFGYESDVTATSLDWNGYPTETPDVPSGEIRQHPTFNAENVDHYTAHRIHLCAFVYGGHNGGPVWRSEEGNRYLQGVLSTSTGTGTAEATRITAKHVADLGTALADDEIARPPIPRPDLAEYVFTTFDNRKDLFVNTVDQNASFGMSYNAYNAGFADAETVTVDFYLSTNPIISSSGDILIGSRTLSIAAGNYANPIAFFDATVPPGVYYAGWILRSSVEEYAGDLDCNGAPCTNVAVIADETLTVTAPNTCGNDADAYEPNDHYTQAGSLPADSPQNHNICPETDHDWSRFTLDTSASYWGVTLTTSGGSGDTRLWLYDADLSEIEFDDNDGTGVFSKIHRACGSRPLAPGTYYVKVDESGNDARIDSYEIERTTVPCAETDPDIHVEPNLLVFDGTDPAQNAGAFSGGDGESLNHPGIDPVKAIDRLLADLGAGEEVRAIVGLRTPQAFVLEGYLPSKNASEQQRFAIAVAQDEFLDALSGTAPRVHRRFESLPFIALSLRREALERMKTLTAVGSVEPDLLASPFLSSSNAVIGSPTAWTAGFDGGGQTVAVLDTGVDSSHPFFNDGAPKVVSEACYSSNDLDADSLCPGGVESSTAAGSGSHCPTTIAGCDHGTHVAGTVAGNDGSGPHFGVARGTDLIAVQVFSRFDSPPFCSGSGFCILSYRSDQVAGLERILALRHTYDIAAVNMSLGSGQFFNEADCDAASTSIKTAVDSLRSVGIVTVAASGNRGYTSAMGSPACLSSTVSVGATTDGDDVAGFSNIASFVDLVAPGESITSSVPGTGTDTRDGTSMAAPHVAGAFAVLKQAAPEAGVQTLLDALLSTAVSVDDLRGEGVVNDLRRIQVDAALDRLNSDGLLFRISNTGTSPLSVSSIAPTTAAPWIDWSPKAPFTIAAGATVYVEVTVDLESAPAGHTFRRLQILSDDPDESPYPNAVDIEVVKAESETPLFEDDFESGGLLSWGTSLTGTVSR